MRRMNYPRFDKPTYTGAYNSAQSGFILDGIPEPGIYFVIMNDTEAVAQYSCMITIDKILQSYGFWYSNLLNEQALLTYLPGGDNLISIIGSNAPVNEGSTIELYKLN